MSTIHYADNEVADELKDSISTKIGQKAGRGKNKKIKHFFTIIHICSAHHQSLQGTSALGKIRTQTIRRDRTDSVITNIQIHKILHVYYGVQ